MLYTCAKISLNDYITLLFRSSMMLYITGVCCDCRYKNLRGTYMYVLDVMDELHIHPFIYTRICMQLYLRSEGSNASWLQYTLYAVSQSSIDTSTFPE